MNRYPAIILAIGFSSAIVGCQRRDAAVNETAGALSPPPEMRSKAGASTASYDLQFLDTMSKHHRMSIDMARTGQGKFAHRELEGMAKKMIEDQGKEVAQMKQWRDQWYPGAPPAENMQMPGMAGMNMDMSHIQTAAGNELDMMFIDMMIPHHQGAIEMARDAITKAEHQEIKSLSEPIMSQQQKEIEQLQQWKSRWSAGK